MKKIVFIFLTVLIVPTSYGVDWTHFGLRPLSMGNAFVSVADDYNALFYNPAGLALIENWDGEFINPRVTVSESSVTILNEVIDSNIGSNSKSGLERALTIIDTASNNLGKTNHVAVQMTPHLIFPHIGIGVGVDILNLDITLHRQVEFDVRARSGLIIPISYAHSFLNDQLHIGGSVKPIIELLSVDERLDVSDYEALQAGTDELDEYLRSGWGVGFDFGLLFQPNIPGNPSMGISITDIGDTSFFETKFIEVPVGAPRKRSASINAGFSIKAINSDNLNLRAAIDFHKLNQIASFSRKIHLGAELSYRSWLKVGAGLHQGYLTGGIQLDAGLVGLKFATYQVEKSIFAGASENLSDRRYSLELHLLL